MKKTAQYSALFRQPSASFSGLVPHLLGEAQEMVMLDRFLKRLKTAGYEKQTSEGLEEFIRRIGDDGLRTASMEFARAFEGICTGTGGSRRMISRD